MTDKELIQRIARERPLPPAGFEARQENLLHGLTGKEGMKMKKKMSAALVLSIVFVFALTAAAVAEISGYSIFSFLENNNALTPEAEKLIQPVNGETEILGDLAEVSIRETLFDGRSVMAALEIRPLRDDILLIPDGGEAMDIGMLIPGAGEDFAVDYAREKGLIPIAVTADSVIEQDGNIPYMDYYDGRIAEDGTLTLIARATLTEPAEALDFPLRVRLIPYIWRIKAETLKEYYGEHQEDELDKSDEAVYISPLIYDFENAQECTLSVHTEKGSVKWRAHSKEEINIPACGVTVTDISLEGYALTTGIKITCKVTDSEAYEKTDDGLFFSILDGSGTPMQSSLDSGGSTFPDENGVFTQTDSLIALDAAPESITLRAFNCWETQNDDGEWRKEVYADIAVEMIPQ